MPAAAQRTDSHSPSRRAAWIMLLALAAGFSLSQAYRTVTAMMATRLAR